MRRRLGSRCTSIAKVPAERHERGISVRFGAGCVDVGALALKGYGGADNGSAWRDEDGAGGKTR